MNFQTSFSVMDATVSASTDLVKQSTSKKRNLCCPMALRKGQNISISHLAEGNDECIVVNGVHG